MTVVSDYTAILAYLDYAAQRWNAGESLGSPVFVSYHFMTPDELPSAWEVAYAVDTVTVLNPAVEDAVRAAMDAIEAVTGITFVEKADGEAMINLHGVTGSDWGGWANYPWVNNGAVSTGSFVLDVSSLDLSSGYSAEVILHELGHAVGLSHTHEGGLTLSSVFDSHRYTLMSYNYTTYPVGELGVLDEQALRHIYGESGAADDWSYGFRDDGVFRVVAGAEDDRVIGVGSENLLKGGGGNDRLIGGGADDRIIGGAGRDVIVGKNGSDVLLGGGGNDKIYASFAGDIYYTADSNRLVGGKGNDRLFGDGGADDLIGGDGDDVISGGYGDDRIVGGKGLDRLNGGGGRDVFVFNPKQDGARDIVQDFNIYSDSLDFGRLTLTMEDLKLREINDGADLVLKIDLGDDAYSILFRDMSAWSMEYHLTSYAGF